MKNEQGIWYPDEENHFPKITHNGYYQGDIFLKAIKYIKKPKLFYDVGAHVGLWSLMALKHGFKTIYAYEPNPKTFECLKKNLSDKGGGYNAKLFQHGVSDIGNPELKIEEEHKGNTGAVKLVHSDYPDISVMPIDHFVAYKMIQKYDLKPLETLVKIDTEGMEAECVLGMEKIIYAFKPVVVVEQRKNNDALDILQDMGMTIAKTIRKDHILTWG